LESVRGIEPSLLSPLSSLPSLLSSPLSPLLSSQSSFFSML
jgi:hypothetical protein